MLCQLEMPKHVIVLHHNTSSAQTTTTTAYARYEAGGSVIMQRNGNITRGRTAVEGRFKGEPCWAGFVLLRVQVNSGVWIMENAHSIPSAAPTKSAIRRDELCTRPRINRVLLKWTDRGRFIYSINIAFIYGILCGMDTSKCPQSRALSQPNRWHYKDNTKQKDI